MGECARPEAQSDDGNPWGLLTDVFSFECGGFRLRRTTLRLAQGDRATRSGPRRSVREGYLQMQ